MLISLLDAQKLGLKNGDPVVVKNDLGELKGQVNLAPLTPGNLQVHWPEGNVLLDKDQRSSEGVPDYNAVVRTVSGILALTIMLRRVAIGRSRPL